MQSYYPRALGFLLGSSALFVAVSFLMSVQGVAGRAALPSSTGPVNAPAPEDRFGVTREQLEILEHLSIVFLEDGRGLGVHKTIRFGGVNVQIVNGLGATNGYPVDPLTVDPRLTRTNGLGNLIVGYNELGNPNGDLRAGSHNVVVGRGNSHGSFGGFLGALNNATLGAFSSVTGGRSNSASGYISSVSGGHYNTASGSLASVSGGGYNTASGIQSAISGGSSNVGSGIGATVGGGQLNTASGIHSWVSGGLSNAAGGSWSTVGGGQLRSATGTRDWVAGTLFEDD